MSDILEREITFLQGVGPKRAELLNSELNILTFKDLLYYFPYRYIDRSKFFKVAEIHENLPYIQLKGRIHNFSTTGLRGKSRLTALCTDDTGSIELVWFKGVRWIKESLDPQKEYVIFGKPTLFNRKINIIHPETEDMETYEKSLVSGLQAMYNTSEKLKNNYITSKTLSKLIQNLLKNVSDQIHETLPEYILSSAQLISLGKALHSIHFPENNGILRKAEYRLKFEELFLIQLNLLRLKIHQKTTFKGFVFSAVGKNFNHFYHKQLPFSLTEAQKRVIKEIRKDLGSGQQMNRLLEGDVGSGKTLVALMCMLIAIDNGFQSCLMAPTEILAVQHFNTMQELLSGMDVNVELLTGSTKKSKRNEMAGQLMDGSLSILIGTHALIEDTVQFHNLGFVVIDEQHRFGVAQRAKLWQKNDQPPHVLVMTATPIPRTLAMTLYGDLDISVIDELPPGRKPVKTVHYYDSRRLRLFGFLKDQIARGQQVYIVYPLIKESETMDYKDLEDGYESIVRAFPPPQYQVSIMHGKMKADDKGMEMQRFKNKETQIMVATTVIEVGIDVPNASVMVIESAERFGLSQLHQLRGRVGRGAEQSYCILMTSVKLSNEARKRIEAMVNSTDGFEIAEIDLKLRGPGDLEGTQQSGIAFDLKIANLGKDGQILQYARDIAGEILTKDPDLSKPKNQLLQKQLSQPPKKPVDWGRIS